MELLSGAAHPPGTLGFIQVLCFPGVLCACYERAMSVLRACYERAMHKARNMHVLADTGHVCVVTCLRPTATETWLLECMSWPIQIMYVL